MLKLILVTRGLIVTGMLLTLGAAPPAVALASETPFPEAGQGYRVAGVAEGDRLNIRDSAGADANVVGSFPPDANGIVVTGSWEKVGATVWWEVVFPNDGRSKTGWLNGRFLVPQLSGLAPGANAGTNYPLNCGGTEPFWSLAIDGDRAQYSLSGEDEKTFEAGSWLDARGLALGSQFAIRLRDAGGEAFLVVVRAHDASCSDGMSDVSYPFYGTIILPDGDVLGGCCSRAAH